MDILSYLLGKKSSGGGGGGESNNVLIKTIKLMENVDGIKKYIIKIDLDLTGVETISYLCDGCMSLAEVNLKNTSSLKTLYNVFNTCYGLRAINIFDTSNATNFSRLFSSCTNLNDVPVFNTSKITSMDNMFSSCSSLTDDSLDNILQMCINAVSYTQTKTLYSLGLRSSSYSAAKIQALPHYQDFIDAGWTIGY